MSSRPLVILAGWLGCKERSLQRYEQLYRSLGLQVVSYIASPGMIVDYTYCRRPTIVPDGWPLSASTEPQSLQDLAWSILATIYTTQSCGFVFHGFSNGGCFLWEQLRRIMMDINQNQQGESSLTTQRDILKVLETRICGVVFDSGPAWFGDKLSSLSLALEHCTVGEKLDIVVRHPTIFLNEGTKAKVERIERCKAFFDFLYHDPLDIPQLYLYSQDDTLARFEPIEQLIYHRQSAQKCLVSRRVWKSSPHCTHLRTHPKDYKMAITKFITPNCLMNARL